jgi:hypothetical protein
VARCRLTATWQLVTLPAVPVYWRATQGDDLPDVRYPASSKITASGANSAAIRSRTGTGSHGEVDMNYCNAFPLLLLIEDARPSTTVGSREHDDLAGSFPGDSANFDSGVVVECDVRRIAEDAHAVTAVPVSGDCGGSAGRVR